jgi:hypothetical protein
MIRTHSEFYIAVDDQEKMMSTTTTAQQQLTFMLEGMDQLLDADNLNVTSHSDNDSTSTADSLESDFYKDSEVEIISNSSRTRTLAPPRSRRWLQEEIELKLSLERSDSLDNFRRRRRRSQQSLQEKIRRDPFGPLEEDSLHLSRSRLPISSRIVRREQPHQNEDEEPWVEGEITIIPLGAPVAHKRAFAAITSQCPTKDN